MRLINPAFFNVILTVIENRSLSGARTRDLDVSDPLSSDISSDSSNHSGQARDAGETTVGRAERTRCSGQPHHPADGEAFGRPSIARSLAAALGVTAPAGPAPHGRLPERHRSTRTLDVVRASSSLLVTLTALALTTVHADVNADADRHTFGSTSPARGPSSRRTGHPDSAPDIPRSAKGEDAPPQA